MAGGEVRLTKVRPELISILLDKLVEAGCEVHRGFDTVTIKRAGAIKPVDVTTDVYPGFATDLQAQFMALMTLATGESVIKETIFENRFMHVPELNRLGADIRVTGSEAHVYGVPELRGLLNGETDRDTAIETGATATRQYAKRQYTWFRRQPPGDWHRTEATQTNDLLEQFETKLHH